MKALTICQPYAHWIVHGIHDDPTIPPAARVKRVENRSWHTHYRGPIAIHAGKSRDWMGGVEPPTDMVFGAVIGVAVLVACLDIDRVTDGTYDRIYPWLRTHEHAHGPFCWVLSGARAIPPVPCRGRQGLWEWEPYAESQQELAL